MAPFWRKKEPKEVFDENLKKANELWESPKLWKSSQYKKLIKHINKAQEIAAKVEVDQEDIVHLWSMKGSVLWRLNRLDEALECYDKVLELNPSDVNAWTDKAVYYCLLGKWQEAIDSCDKATELDPKNIEAWCNKGHALSRLRRHEEALTCYDRALEINPMHWVSLNDKGAALYQLGRYEEALECINKSLEYSPKEVRKTRDAPGGRHIPKDVKTLLNKVRVLGTLAGRDLYDLSKQRPEEWSQKERKVEKMHKEIETCLLWAAHFDPYEFLHVIIEIGEDWESRGGLEVLYKGCADCKEIGLVTVGPLYFGKKREGWGFSMEVICPHMKKRLKAASFSFKGEYPISDTFFQKGKIKSEKGAKLLVLEKS